MLNPVKFLFIVILLIRLSQPILTVSASCSMRLRCCK
ncbi:hypothetical protein BMETH_279_0 [methanotrophic bacterial endosymbiont of Bathymodiolus sp.]|nr:hypothetical protein BMETH_279_0 [methanotrophic bacterial endosymbiont of Bathymodiolus sp.]